MALVGKHSTDSDSPSEMSDGQQLHFSKSPTGREHGRTKQKARTAISNCRGTKCHGFKVEILQISWSPTDCPVVSQPHIVAKGTLHGYRITDIGSRANSAETKQILLPPWSKWHVMRCSPYNSDRTFPTHTIQPWQLGNGHLLAILCQVALLEGNMHTKETEPGNWYGLIPLWERLK